MDECHWDDNDTSYEIKDNTNDSNGSANYEANTETNGSVDGGMCRIGDFIGAKHIYGLQNPISLGDTYSVSTWIKFPLNDKDHITYTIDSTDYQYYNIADRNGSTNSFIFFMKKKNHYFGSWKWYWAVDDANGDPHSSKEITMPSDGWHLVTFNVSDSNTSRYTDGNYTDYIDYNLSNIKLNRVFASDYENNDGNQTIGAYTDEFKIFDENLSDDDIKSIYDNENAKKNWDGTKRVCTCGIRANWWMDECSWNGTTDEVGDFSDYDNNGTAEHNATTESNKTVGGVIYRVGDFNSSDANSSVDVSNSSSLTFDWPLIYMTWMKLKDPNQQTNDDHLENMFTNESWANALRFTEKGHWNGGQQILFSLSIDNDTKYLYSSKQITDTKWHHITAIYDGAYMRIYIDGQEDVNQSETGSITTNTGDNMIASEYNQYYFKGFLDETKVFHQDLNSSQINDIYNNEKDGKNWDGSTRDAPTCPVDNNNNDKNSTFDAWDTFRDINDKNISTKIVAEDFNLTIASLDENGSNYQEFNGTVCSRIIKEGEDNVTDWFKNFFSDKNTSDQTDEGNPQFNVGVAIKKAKAEIIWLKDANKSCSDVQSSSDHNETNSTDNFAIRPNEFNITAISASIYAGENFNISFVALNANDKNTTDYNESKGDSFLVNATEIKSGCKTGDFNLSDFNFSNGGASNIDANYSEVGEINITIKDSNNSHSFAYVDVNDTNDSVRLIASKSKIVAVKPYEINITDINFTVTTGTNWLYMDKNISDMNITLGVTLKALNKQGDALEDFNDTCYAKDVNVTFYYDVNNSEEENLTLDGNLTSDDVNISDINKTLQIPKKLFVSGKANSNYAFGVDRNYSDYKNPLHVALKDVNITTTNIAKNENNATSDKNATFYYARTYTQDLATSKTDDNVTVAILVYDKNASNGYVDGFKEELLNWYKNSKHTAKDGNITNAKVSKTIVKSGDDDGISASISGGDKGVFTITVTNDNNKTGTHYIHLSENNWLWYVPQGFGSDYNDTNDSTCIGHPCIKYNFINNNSNDKNDNTITSGNTNGVQFYKNVTHNNKGVRLFR